MVGLGVEGCGVVRWGGWVRGRGLLGVLGGIVIGDIGVDSVGYRNGECCYLGDVDGCRGVGGGIIVAGCIRPFGETSGVGRISCRFGFAVRFFAVGVEWV